MFEAIQIDEQNSNFFRAAASLQQHLICTGLQQAAIGQASELVVVRQVPDAQPVLLPLHRQGTKVSTSLYQLFMKRRSNMWSVLSVIERKSSQNLAFFIHYWCGPTGLVAQWQDQMPEVFPKWIGRNVSNQYGFLAPSGGSTGADAWTYRNTIELCGIREWQTGTGKGTQKTLFINLQDAGTDLGGDLLHFFANHFQHFDER